MSNPTEAEVSLARRLTHTEKGIRDAAFDVVSKWLTSPQNVPITKTAEQIQNDEVLEMKKVWKALFYCVWMSDKVPVQQELIFRISTLLTTMAVSSNKKLQNRAVLFFQEFFEVMRREWLGLDRYRVDKFMSLYRRMVGAGFRSCFSGPKSSFKPSTASELMQILEKALTLRPNGIRLHLLDIYSQELASNVPNASSDEIVQLLGPLFTVLKTCSDREVFDRALKSTLEEGILRQIITVHDKLRERHVEAEPITIYNDPTPAYMSEIAQTLRQAQQQREEALKVGLKNLNISVLAQEIWKIASHPDTVSINRDGLYKFHKILAPMAMLLGHATSDEELYGSREAMPKSLVRKREREEADLEKEKTPSKKKLEDSDEKKAPKVPLELLDLSKKKKKTSSSPSKVSGASTNEELTRKSEKKGVAASKAKGKKRVATTKP